MNAISPLAVGLGAFLALSSAALAADAPAAAPQPALSSTDLTKVAKGSYALDPDHANVIFEISHLGFSEYIGRFDKISGTLDFNNTKPEKSKLKVSIDTASIDTKVAALDTHLKTADFFDATKYPEIKFKSTKVEKLSDTTGKVTGDLTLHGVTKPVTLDVTFHGAGTHPMTKKSVIGFGARGTIKRSDFGMDKYISMVGDEVTLVIESEFDGEPAK
jgi:polyisoprenoid-binding protein YceI